MPGTEGAAETGPPPFGSASSRAVLRAACAAVGLDSQGAQLLRLGENALYRLATVPVVVRIARTMDYWPDAAKEVAVARWLAAERFPGATLHDDLSQPVAAAGHPVTFWRYLPGRPADATEISVLAVLLRRLHALRAPRDFGLPCDAILGRVAPRIETSPVSLSDKEFLLQRLEELRRGLSSLEYPLPAGPIHGDAHIKNVMMTDGNALLIDFERFAWGQREWDLAMTATEYQTAGWWTARQYAEFCEAYGYDITEWSGFSLLRQTHELKMVSWVMQNISESSEVADEYHLRMRTLRNGTTERAWSPL